MIRCPYCDHPAPVGSLFCQDCGARFTAPNETITRQVKAEKQPDTKEMAAREQDQSARYALQELKTGKIIPLNSQEDFTLGRRADGQPILPDIDLTALDGYNAGVSRLHAGIHLDDAGVVLTDLNSANGTWVNDTRLEPHAPQSIQHGDVIVLGKLRLRVLIQSKPAVSGA